MGIRWKGDDFARHSDRINHLGSNVVDDMVESMENIARYGWAKTKQFVETRGVASNPNPGRIRTGEMHDALGWEVKKEGNEIYARFGWVDGGPPWSLWQEEGTRGGQGNGSGIEAMQALLDAYVMTREMLRDRGLMYGNNDNDF